MGKKGTRGLELLHIFHYSSQKSSHTAEVSRSGQEGHKGLELLHIFHYSSQKSSHTAEVSRRAQGGLNCFTFFTTVARNLHILLRLVEGHKGLELLHIFTTVARNLHILLRITTLNNYK